MDDGKKDWIRKLAKLHAEIQGITNPCLYQLVIGATVHTCLLPKFHSGVQHFCFVCDDHFKHVVET